MVIFLILLLLYETVISFAFLGISETSGHIFLCFLSYMLPSNDLHLYSFLSSAGSKRKNTQTAPIISRVLFLFFLKCSLFREMFIKRYVAAVLGECWDISAWNQIIIPPVDGSSLYVNIVRNASFATIFLSNSTKNSIFINQPPSPCVRRHPLCRPYSVRQKSPAPGTSPGGSCHNLSARGTGTPHSGSAALLSWR